MPTKRETELFELHATAVKQAKRIIRQIQDSRRKPGMGIELAKIGIAWATSAQEDPSYIAYLSIPVKPGETERRSPYAWRQLFLTWITEDAASVFEGEWQSNPLLQDLLLVIDFYNLEDILASYGWRRELPERWQNLIDAEFEEESELLSRLWLYLPEGQSERELVVGLYVQNMRRSLNSETGLLANAD